MGIACVRKMWRPAAALLCGAILLAGCGDDETAEQAAPPERAAVEIGSVRVEAIELADPILGTGTIAPSQRTDLGPRVDGIIEQIYVRVGERVTKDQPLFRTRDIDFKLKVQELENEMKLAEASAKEASREFSRIASLAKKGVASSGALDKARASHEVAQARLGVAQAKLDQAKQALEDAVVVAPYDGVITARNVHEGKFMATRMGGSMGGGSSGVVEIMEINYVAAIVNVPEVHLGQLHVGMPAIVHVDGLQDTFESAVLRINDYIDPVKRTVEVRIALENSDYRVKPGSFTRAELIPDPRTALVLPRATVLGFDTNQYVMVEDGGVAKRHPIQTVQLDAERVEIRDGLKAGDTVLAGPGVRALVEGTPVKVITEPEQISAVAPPDEAATGTQ